MKHDFQMSTRDIAKIVLVAAVSAVPAARLREFPPHVAVLLSIWIFAVLLPAAFRNWGMAAAAFVFLGFPTLWIVLGTTVNHARVDARENRCLNDVRLLALAIANYEAENGPLPAYLADENGNPMHSWRVLVLPYAEEPFLYKDYDFSKAWNSPENLALPCPYWFRSAAHGSAPDNFTSYVAVVGLGTAWDRSVDADSSSIRIIESPEDSQHWLDPHSPSLEDVLARPQPFKSDHQFGDVIVGYTDGTANKIPASTNAATWREMFTGIAQSE